MEFPLLLMMKSNHNDKDDQNSSLRPTFIPQKGQVESSSVLTHLFSWCTSFKLSEHDKNKA